MVRVSFMCSCELNSPSPRPDTSLPALLYSNVVVKLYTTDVMSIVFDHDCAIDYFYAKCPRACMLR